MTTDDKSVFSPANYHLLISAFIIILAALMYGVAPAITVPRGFDISVETVDLANVFRVIMCLYLAVAVVWLLGAIKRELWLAATITNIVFMGSLAAGRIISLALDGVPSGGLIFGMIAEFVLCIFGLVQYRKYAPK